VIDPRCDRMALLIVERMLAVADGQTLAIVGPTSAADLIERVAWRAARIGAAVTVDATPPAVERAILEGSSPERLAREDRVARVVAETVDARLRVDVPWPGDALAGVPADRIVARIAGARAGAETILRRSAAGELRWAVALHPDPEHADLVYAAAFCDEDEPIAAWAAQEQRQAGLRTVLEAGSTLQIRAGGTDLKLAIGGRPWRSSAGNRNIPDGELFTAPIEDSAEGRVRFTYPAVRDGHEIVGIELELERGVVVHARAERGADALAALLQLDEGARRLGEVGIGTNYRIPGFSANTLLDEKIGGTCHLALGRGYLETGSRNRSALHWDLVCDLRDGGELLLDGRAIQRDGRFLDGLLG
jgi:aminopeptidase